MAEIRKATESDIEAWRGMRHALYGEVDPEITRFDIERLLQADDEDAFLAFDGAHVIGMLEMALRNLVDGCSSSPVAYIEGLYVIPGQRGRGIGKDLVEFAHEWARRKGCREIACDSEIDDETAQDFHRHMGFEETFRLVLFRKDLDSPERANRRTPLG